ncbi:hypothetical protein Bbelb_355560 [Branchiostoma belcheri]|nr:hypothetical protein Bbelb_355560 [Branchiostoma belcheri]
MNDSLQMKQQEAAGNTYTRRLAFVGSALGIRWAYAECVRKTGPYTGLILSFGHNPPYVLLRAVYVQKRRASVRGEYHLRTESYGFGSTQTRRRTLSACKTFSACGLRIHHPCVGVRATRVPRTYRTKDARIPQALMNQFRSRRFAVPYKEKTLKHGWIDIVWKPQENNGNIKFNKHRQQRYTPASVLPSHHPAAAFDSLFRSSLIYPHVPQVPLSVLHTAHTLACVFAGHVLKDFRMTLYVFDDFPSTAAIRPPTSHDGITFRAVQRFLHAEITFWCDKLNQTYSGGRWKTDVECPDCA